MKDEFPIWENGTNKRERKYCLTMVLQEAYKNCPELSVSNKMKFSKFCDLCPKNVLLLKQSPVNQCKYIIQEIFLLS